MASAFTHAAVGLALGTAFRRPGPPARFWVAGAALAALPDLDALSFRLGVPYASLLGHRGLSHSLAAAALLAAATVGAAFRGPAWRAERGWLWSYLFLAAASHGLLDMLTNGGHGVALFAPFENGRHFFPWRPVEVSPISVRRFLTARGAAVLASEFRWVWLPAAAFAAACVVARRRREAPVSPAA